VAPAPVAGPPMGTAPPVNISAPRPAPSAPEARAGDEYPDLLAQIIRTVRPRGADPSMADEAARARLRPSVEQAVRGLGNLPSGVTPDRVIHDVVTEIGGGGAIESALGDPEVTAILVDGHGRVSVARNGGALAPSGYWFSGGSAVVECVDRWLRANGLDRAGKSTVNVTLGDGTRVLGAFAPLTHQGAVVNIERNPARALTLQDMAARASLPAPAVHLLTNALNARRNVVVVGPRSSGRRMVLGALLASIPMNDRVMIVEDRDELTRSRRDAAALRAEGDWSLAADLATRMRAHRIVFSETNESVARAFVGALSTGAEGMLLTVEAPSALTGLGRLAALAAHGAGLSRDEAAARLVATRPLIVETARFGDGQCRVTGISELRGSESNMQVSGLFTVRIEGADAAGNLSVHLVPTGASPSFA